MATPGRGNTVGFHAPRVTVCECHGSHAANDKKKSPFGDTASTLVGGRQKHTWLPLLALARGRLRRT